MNWKTTLKGYFLREHAIGSDDIMTTVETYDQRPLPSLLACAHIGVLSLAIVSALCLSGKLFCSQYYASS
jgi:hypothetical protein